MRIRKEETKLSLFVDGMILCIENSEDSTKMLLGLIKEFSEVSGFKINLQKSFMILYTNNKSPGKKNKENDSIYNSIKHQHLGMNVTKVVKDVYTKNGRTLMRVEKTHVLNLLLTVQL